MKLPISFLVLVFGFAVLAACATATRPLGPAAESVPAAGMAAAAAASTATHSPSGLTATPFSASALRGNVVYSYEGDIYSMRADGAEIARLTSDPAPDFDPVWSPDGKYIAFRSHRDGNEEVYLMNADGSGQRNLSNAPGGDYSPAWSPDGRWIAFMSDRGGNANLWMMRPDGADVRQVTDLPGISEYPTWSPDSRRLAFHCTFGRVLPGGVGDFEICVVNADGTGLVQLTDAPGESKLPAWSPDGASIAFQSSRNGWPTLPDYTPPGYDPDRLGDYEIYIMQPDGSGQRNLTNHPEADDTFPAWSLHGQLIFSRYGCLLLAASDGSSMVQISKGVCTGTDSGMFPDWYAPAP